MEGTPHSLDNFFKAQSVAVIGASSTPGKIGHEVLRSLVEYGYKGRVYPVNPRATEILGVKCYRTLTEIPDRVDLAVFTIASNLAPDIMEECGRKGVRNVVVISGGFKELGGDYRELEGRMVATAKKSGIRVIGPNCIGVYDSETKLDTFFQSRERMTRPDKGPVAFLTQSGTFGCSMIEWLAESGIGVSKLVSYGNRCDVDEADLIEYLADDPATAVISLYIEGLGDGRKFFEAARRVTPRKPILVLKSGRTERGATAAKSHTGWLAGSYDVYSAAFRQAGIVSASNFEELFDITKAAVLQPPSRGNRIAMVTNGAGPCVMAADESSKYGVELAEYEPKTREELKSKLPPFCVIGNPVDLTGSATSQDYKTAIDALIRDRNVDVMMPFFVFQDTPLDEGIVEVIAQSASQGKTIVCCASGGEYTAKMSSAMESRGIPVYPIPERAIVAVSALIRLGQIHKS